MVQAKYFEQLAEGEEFISPSRTIAECVVHAFAGLTGDLTDFHISEQAGKDSVFGRRVAHGMLLISIANGLFNRIGVTDGTGMALTGVEWRFRAPVFLGDTVYLVVSVDEKRDTGAADRGLVFWNAELLKVDGVTTCFGKMARMVRKRSPAGP